MDDRLNLVKVFKTATESIRNRFFTLGPTNVDHSQLNLKFLKLKYLPPNTTSVIQPIDAGIIHYFW